MPDVHVLQPRPPSLAQAEVLARRWFSDGPVAIAPLAAQGFSGSPLYRVEAGGGLHVLKAFASGTSSGRVHFVHAVMQHLRSRGMTEVPPVREAAGNTSFVGGDDGQFWEMQGFIAGESTPQPSHGQADAAIAVLARIHLAAATLAENPPDVGPSPGITRRIEQARGMLARPWAGIQAQTDGGRRLDTALAEKIGPRLAHAASALVAADGMEIVAAVASLAPGPLPRQTVLRDVWAPHVLYAGRTSDQVVGIVDYHAAGLDTPATDLARLLGSWAVEAGFATAAVWSTGLAAYEAVRPLCVRERRLVPFLAASGVVFGLDNWFRWIFEEGRHFPDHDAVADRIDRLVAALPAALAMIRFNCPAARV